MLPPISRAWLTDCFRGPRITPSRTVTSSSILCAIVPLLGQEPFDGVQPTRRSWLAAFRHTLLLAEPVVGLGQVVVRVRGLHCGPEPRRVLHLVDRELELAH